MMFAQANSSIVGFQIFNDWTLDGEDQPNSLFGMIRNTHKLGAKMFFQAYSDNAAVVAGSMGGFYPDPVSKEYGYSQEPVHLLMKVETHNHPTAIAPFLVPALVLVVKFAMRVRWVAAPSQNEAVGFTINFKYRIISNLGKRIMVSLIVSYRPWIS